MIKFPSHSDCSHPKCPHRETCTHIGMATEPYGKGYPSRKVATLICGDHPGYYEDSQNKLWASMAGQYLRGFIEESGLPLHSDIYLTNIVRCRPGFRSKPTKTHANYCKPYTLHDLSLLSEQYPLLILFIQGALTCRSLLNLSLTEAFSFQRERLPEPPHPTVFLTYNPAILEPGRKPQLIHAVTEHWKILLDYLKYPHSNSQPSSPPSFTRNLQPPTYSLERKK